MANIKIAIDAGHGSKTAGKRTPPFTKDVDIDGDGRIDIKKGNQYKEHYASVGVANLLYRKLNARGYDIIKVGWNDTNSKDDSDISLSSRQSKIKKAGCDYSISIHFNASGDGISFTSPKGVSVYIHNKYSADSRHLAEYALRELIKNTPQNNRGINVARLAMCNCNTMNTKASILCELAFMTNQYEAMELMASSKFWEECAEELADAVDLYCNCNNKEEIVTRNYATIYHTVVAGETLSSIAAGEDIGLMKLLLLNDIEDPDKIYVGQKLLLGEYFLYTVKQGDTLSEISRRFLKDTGYVDDIRKMNNLNNDTIYNNQMLKIPVIS